MEASVVVDHDKDRGDRPSVLIDIVREIRPLKEPSSLGNDLSDQREELCDPVCLQIRIREDTAYMDRFFKHGEHLRAEIKRVYIQLLRCIV